MDAEFSHLDPKGHARMVDVAAKAETLRSATARATVRFGVGVRERVLAGDLPKGAVLETARIAAVLAAKRTAELIPMCHPLRLSGVEVTFTAVGTEELQVDVRVQALDRTGVEMEAMTAASIAALTIYDMVKAVDRSMLVREISLLRKSGGKSGDWKRSEV
ncbi:MAG: cyclic pyranopterin monophosphate synthase MoaC [Planctomycetes bacterium]|nr:cyclic pyranopterin monophosphate synthase MoaC [Planctomycetota bacterium]